MCLKKTPWYSFIYPIRVGAIIAPGSTLDPKRFSRFGWYFGAAFQIQDDLLNLTGEFAKSGKELGGDIAEGKRTLMLIHLLAACTAREACTDALSREALRKAVSSRNRRGLCANGRLRQHRISATLGAPARRCHLARSRHRLPRRARFTSEAVHLPDGHVCGERASKRPGWRVAERAHAVAFADSRGESSSLLNSSRKNRTISREASGPCGSV